MEPIKVLPHQVGKVRLTPKFSCKHTITFAAKPHPKSACQLQRSLGRGCVVAGMIVSVRTNDPLGQATSDRMDKSKHADRN